MKFKSYTWVSFQIYMLLSLEAMSFGLVWLERGTVLTSSEQGELDYCLTRYGNGVALLSRVLYCCRYG